MKTTGALLAMLLLTGCVHGGRDITGGGVTAYSGRTGAFDSGNTEYQHTFCEGGEPYTDEHGKFQCDGGHVVYRYTSVTSPSILAQIIGLGGPAAIAYAGHEVGNMDAGKTTVTQQGGGAQQSQGQVQQQHQKASTSSKAVNSNRVDLRTQSKHGRR